MSNAASKPDSTSTQQYPPIMLSGLAGGALEERWQLELQRAIENIQDPNTDPTKKRVITLVVEITPNDERTMGDVTISASAKLSAQKSVSSLIYMGHTAKGVIAVEHNPLQLTFDQVAPLQFGGPKEAK